MSLAIIIVNWNSGQQLTDAVKSILSQRELAIDQIIIVDNASNDNSLRTALQLAPSHSGIQFIENSRNVGFAAACNQGALLAQTDFLLFLNPDTMLFEDSIETSVNFLSLDCNSDIGILGIQLKDESGNISRSCARFPSASGFLLHSLALDRLFPTQGHRMMEWDHKQNRRVDQVIGAFFMVRRALFEQLMGFDERFFVYFEEVDFSYRANQAGWRSMYLADCSAFHAGGGTSQQVKAKRLFYSLRSRLLYALKHFSIVQILIVFLASLGIEPLSRLFLALAHGSHSELGQILDAYRMLWADMPNILRKRAN